MANEPEANEPKGWADKPRNRQIVRGTIYVACLLLVVAEFFVHRHISTPIERVPAFYALYGFAALVGVVMAAKGLRLLVKRDEEYYDQ
jgi:peptidoglycan/LPS O-acetylase OafA/YrhL